MHLTRSRIAALLVALALVAVACGDDTSEGASGESGSDDVTASDVWARSTAENQTNGAVYMVLSGGAEDDALVGASVSEDIAATVEIHETVMVDDDEMSDDDHEGHDHDDEEMSDDDHEGHDHDDEEMSDDDMDGMGSMTMQEVSSIEVPAGGSATLEPGGYHVMLIDLAAPLEAGDEFDLTLTFESGEELDVTVEVRDS